MRMTIGMFNLVITSIKEDTYNEIITENFKMTNKMKTQMLIYRKLLNTHGYKYNNFNKLYTKDLNLIAEFLGLFQYISTGPEYIQQWLCDSIELSEKEDSEGEYLKFCNITLKIKKMFEIIADYPCEITADDIFLDSTHVWVYFHE